MRSGLLIPVSSDVLAVSLIAAIILTLLWFIYHIITHINKRLEESSFNESCPKVDSSAMPEPVELAQLLSRMPFRSANIDGGTVLFWTNDGPLALAVARASPKSHFKVFLRTDRSAGELGHKLLVSNSLKQRITFRLTAESLIFSSTKSTLYDVDIDSLNSLVNLLKDNSCFINEIIEIPADSATSLIRSVSQALYVCTHSQEKLLIGN